MTQKRKGTTVWLPSEIVEKFREISEKSGFSMVEILSQWIEGIYPFVEKHTRVSLVTVPSKIGFYCGAIPMAFGAFQMPIDASDEEVDKEVKRRIEVDFEGDEK